MPECFVWTEHLLPPHSFPHSAQLTLPFFPDPEWASINLGVLLCIQCSGVHRGLGVQLSKVRSIVLDNVESEVMLIISRLGNERVNAILEAKIPQTVTQSYRT